MGNAITETQYSTFIRCENDLECNGHSFAKGDLLRHDLNSLPGYIPGWVKNEIGGYCQNRKVIFFCLRHFRNRRPVILSYFITDTNHNLMWIFVMKNGCKNRQVIESFLKALHQESMKKVA